MTVSSSDYRVSKQKPSSSLAEAETIDFLDAGQEEIIVFEPEANNENIAAAVPLAETSLLPQNYSSSYQLAYTEGPAVEPYTVPVAQDVSIIEDPQKQHTIGEDNSESTQSSSGHDDDNSNNARFVSSVPRPNFMLIKQRRKGLQASAAVGGAVAGFFLAGPVGSLLLGATTHTIVKGIGRRRERRIAAKYVQRFNEEVERRALPSARVVET